MAAEWIAFIGSNWQWFVFGSFIFFWGPVLVTDNYINPARGIWRLILLPIFKGGYNLIQIWRRTEKKATRKDWLILSVIVLLIILIPSITFRLGSIYAHGKQACYNALDCKGEYFNYYFYDVSEVRGECGCNNEVKEVEVKLVGNEMKWRLK